MPSIDYLGLRSCTTGDTGLIRNLDQVKENLTMNHSNLNISNRWHTWHQPTTENHRCDFREKKHSLKFAWSSEWSFESLNVKDQGGGGAKKPRLPSNAHAQTTCLSCSFFRNCKNPFPPKYLVIKTHNLDLISSGGTQASIEKTH